MASSPHSIRAHTELIHLRCDWQTGVERERCSPLMASSEVDQKYLGRFAKETSSNNSFLSAMLYKILGLSVILSKKLLRARQLRFLDPVHDVETQELHEHIIWLSKEGLVLVEQYILPMVSDYIELKVLSYKLQASFYHIFVLFYNQPSLQHATFTSHASASSTPTQADYDQSFNWPNPPSFPPGGPAGHDTSPPGLLPHSSPQPPPPPPPPPPSQQPAMSFLIPQKDYVPIATSCFTTAAALSDSLLPGSHPIRLSIKLEYAAFMYDCLHDAAGSRFLAKQTIADVYNAEEGMDDEAFEDAAELVGVLAKMMKRGLLTSPQNASAAGSGSPGSEGTIRAGKQRASTAEMRNRI